ncbi:MAG TPA: dinitrogenase iron-molybdenum cofactor biosynthesis protein [Rhodocyclaceae bacterium]|nr:dinitrogenase iron-molybdenum cofactor biosynthesis protein [Rhodocyclaceae bacterium]
MSAPMTREAALRIGLAARALPGIEPRALASAIADKFGLPMSEATLANVTVADLKVILQGDEIIDPDYTSEQLKSAVRLLWGEGVQNADNLPIQAYTDGDMPGSIRVAVASNSEEKLDGHFGSCERFLIYQVSPTEIRLIGVRPTLEADTVEDRNAARSEVINDCQVVYVQSIGGPAAAKVVRAGVHPVKIPKVGPAQDTLAQLQATLSAPPPWLAKIMGVEASSLARFAEMVEEEDEA